MKRVGIPQAIKDGAWPRVQPASVPQEQWPFFARKRLAVELYIDGHAMTEIRLRTGFPASEVNRIVDRFCAIDADGHYFGERALLANARVTLYERRKAVGPKRTEQRGGMSGLLNKLLGEHSNIELAMIERLRRPGAPHDSTRSELSYLINEFYKLLNKAGISAPAWPFNTKHAGRTSIRKYLKRLRARYAVQYIHSHGSQEAVAHLATGTGHERYIKAERPFDCVQLDGHYIDAFFALRVEQAPGIYQWITIDRIWLLSMIEPFSNAVLAYKLVLRSEVSAADVREVIAQACLGHWRPRELVNQAFPYTAGAGLPSGVLDECHGIGCGVFFADSALSNLAKKITTTARCDFGFHVCIGPAGHFETRAEIERSFLEVARTVHQLMSSTGSSPRQGRVNEAEQKAATYEIDLLLMEDAMDVFLCNYNAKPTEGLGWLSPLAYLRQYFDQGMLHPHYEADQIQRLEADMSTVKVTVRGGLNSGRRPHIQLDRARYTNEVLAGDFGFVGMELLIKVDYHDYRAIEAYLPNGECLGFLRAQGYWGTFKHTPTVRRRINSLIRTGDLRIDSEHDPVPQLVDYFTQHGQAAVALSISRDAATSPTKKTTSKKQRVLRPDYFLQPDVEYGELPTPGKALNRGER